MRYFLGAGFGSLDDGGCLGEPSGFRPCGNISEGRIPLRAAGPFGSRMPPAGTRVLSDPLTGFLPDPGPPLVFITSSILRV